MSNLDKRVSELECAVDSDVDRLTAERGQKEGVLLGCLSREALDNYTERLAALAELGDDPEPESFLAFVLDPPYRSQVAEVLAWVRGGPAPSWDCPWRQYDGARGWHTGIACFVGEWPGHPEMSEGPGGSGGYPALPGRKWTGTKARRLPGGNVIEEDRGK